MVFPDKIPTRSAALEVAAELLSERFPEADLAFVAGSIIRGTATLSSDIDIVVIHAHLPAAYRTSLIYQGIPIEAFVHDGATLSWFFDADAKAGRPVLARMVAEGVVIGPNQVAATRLRAMATAVLGKGPPALDRVTLDGLRYGISDLLADLQDERPISEKVAIGAALYTALGNFILRSNGRWIGSGKWLPREVAAFDHAVGQAFVSAFEALFRIGDTDPVLKFAMVALQPHGGMLFEGYHSVAPAEARK